MAATKTPITTELAQKNITILRDVKSSGTEGGGFTSGSWQTRDLNTIETYGKTVCSLSSNQFTLTPGKYYIEATAPAYAVGRNQARLQNITDSSTEILGSSEYVNTTIGAVTTSKIIGVFTITKNTTFEIQHQCETTRTTNGFGIYSGFGNDSVYTQVKIEQIQE